jgi:flagellin
MRALVVQARSDLQSVADRGMMQSELTQLTLEINKIASNTNFNGRALLDGSASSALLLRNRILITTNAPTGSGTSLLDQSVDPNQPSLWPGAFLPGASQMAQSITVDSYDPVTDTVQITVVFGSQDASFGPEQTAAVQIQNGSNVQPGNLPPAPGAPTFFQSDQNGAGNLMLSFNVGQLSPQDVGKSAFLVTLPGQQANPGGTLYVNTGNAEGSVVGIDIPGLSAVNLGVNNVQLGTDLQNTAAEYRVDYAIQALGAVRAQVGAQTVSLQEEAASNQIASVATQASESAIRDLNVGATMTQFVRDQVLVNFQTRLIADSEHLSQIYATLVSDALVH